MKTSLAFGRTIIHSHPCVNSVTIKEGLELSFPSPSQLWFRSKSKMLLSSGRFHSSPWKIHWRPGPRWLQDTALLCLRFYINLLRKQEQVLQLKNKNKKKNPAKLRSHFQGVCKVEVKFKKPFQKLDGTPLKCGGEGDSAGKGTQTDTK